MNRVLAHTGAQYPILQAPMGWIARSALAGARLWSTAAATSGAGAKRAAPVAAA